MMNPEASALGPGALMQMLQGHHVSAVMMASLELGLFGAIEGGRETAKIAEKIGCPPRTTQILLDALVTLGLVKRDGGRYENTALASAHLVPGAPQYLGDMSQLFASPMMWQGLSRLTDAVKAGGSVLPEHAETPKHPFWEVFARSTVAMSVPNAMALQAELGPWLATRPSPTALDVAAGSGTYGCTLIRENKGLHATLLDWPNVLVETRKMVERMGVDQSRVHTIEGDLFAVDFKGPYDVVLLSQLLHHFEPAVCQKLVTKAAAALKPGGKLVIHDFLTDGDNPAARIFAVTMLAWTKQGQAYAGADCEKWIREAGLQSSGVRPISGMPTSFVLAQKG